MKWLILWSDWFYEVINKVINKSDWLYEVINLWSDWFHDRINKSINYCYNKIFIRMYSFYQEVIKMY